MEDHRHRLLANARVAEEPTHGARQRSPLGLVEAAYRHFDARELRRRYLLATVHEDRSRFDENNRNGVHRLTRLAGGNADLPRKAAPAVRVKSARRYLESRHAPQGISRHLTTYPAAVPERKLISSGSPFEEQIGYSRAVVDGEWVHVSGTTGFDYGRMAISDDVVEQAEQCMRNIAWALDQAGSSLADVVRVRYMLPDANDFERCWPVLRRYFGSVRPAATMMACGLSDPRMKIEIEVTARRR